MATNLKSSLAGFSMIVGAAHVRPATAADAVDGLQPQVLIEPGSVEEVARVLNHAREAGLALVTRGGGTKMEWGDVPLGVDAVLSMKRLNRVLEHASADMTATVEAGCHVAHFQQVMAEHGQCLASDALWPERATIGGILATNDSGARRVRYGALRDLIIGITVALPDGTVAKSGGKVVKNVAGYDLPKLFTGSFGTLGVITDATFRLYPLAREARTLSFRTNTTDSANSLALAIHDSTLSPTGIQLRVRSDESTHMDVRFEGVAAAIEAQTEQLLSLASGAEQVPSAADSWAAREKLWDGAEPALVCKFSVLPSQIGSFFALTREVANSCAVTWRAVAQSIGLGLLRLEGAHERGLLSALAALRGQSKEFGCSLVVLHCAPEMKSGLDVWAAESDALPLMRRIKQQFDPTGLLNRGRFVGRI